MFKSEIVTSPSETINYRSAINVDMNHE